MYSVSEDYLAAVAAVERRFAVRASAGSVSIPEDRIISVSVKESVNAGDVITMGTACASYIEAEMLTPPDANMSEGISLSVEAGLLVGDEFEWVPLGVFDLISVSSTNNNRTIKITGYDRMMRLEATYVPGISSWPATYQDILDDIATQHGIAVADCSAFPEYTVDLSEATLSCRDIVGYIAGYGVQTRDLTVRARCSFRGMPISGVEIMRQTQRLGGVKRTTKDLLTIQSVRSGTKDNQSSAGNGTGIVFDNPWITQAMVNAIYEAVVGTQYMPCTISWRGNPALMAGDAVSCETTQGDMHTVLISSLEIVFSGGCRSNVSCAGKSDAEITLTPLAPTDKKLQQVVSTLGERIIEATRAITGQNGGYYVVNSTENGIPFEVLFLDDPDISVAQNVWRWNLAGLGFSSTGYGGVYDLAITSDGKINADFIYAGTINSDVIFTGEIRGVVGTFTRLIAGDPDGARIEEGLDEHGDPRVQLYDDDGTASSYLAKDRLGLYSSALRHYTIGARTGMGIFAGD